MQALLLALLATVQTSSTQNPQRETAGEYYRRLADATPEAQLRKAHNDALKPKFADYQQCVYAAAKQFSSSNETAPVVAQSAVQKCAKRREGLFGQYDDTFVNKQAFFKLLDKHVIAEATMIVVEARSTPPRKRKR